MEATSCPKGGNMWRYWYGLTQAWGSTTYDWALGQILLRCREEVLPAEPDRELCQREDTGLPWGKPYRGRIHIWDYPEGIRPYGHLAQYRGWPETRFTIRETELEEKKVLVSPGEGEWHSKRDTGQFFPPITYPIHGKRLAQRRDCRILRRCSVSPSPQLCRCLPKRHRAPTHGRRQHSEWSEPSPPRGHGSPCDWYSKVTASTILWANLCLETDFPFCWLPRQTKSCSEFLKLRVRSTYMRNALTGHSNAKAGSASSEGSACRFTTWSQKDVVGTLGTYPGRGLKTTWEYTGPNTRHSLLTENAWRSPSFWWKWALSSRQEFQLYWVQRLKGAPLKSSQDDREVPRGHKGYSGGVHPPGTLQEPHDEIMLSQGPAVHCIVVGHFKV